QPSGSGHFKRREEAGCLPHRCPPVLAGARLASVSERERIEQPVGGKHRPPTVSHSFNVVRRPRTGVKRSTPQLFTTVGMTVGPAGARGRPEGGGGGGGRGGARG